MFEIIAQIEDGYSSRAAMKIAAAAGFVFLLFAGYIFSEMFGEHARVIASVALAIGMAGLLVGAVILNVSPPTSKNFGDDTKDYVLAASGLIGVGGLCFGGCMFMYWKTRPSSKRNRRARR